MGIAVRERVSDGQGVEFSKFKFFGLIFAYLLHRNDYVLGRSLPQSLIKCFFFCYYTPMAIYYGDLLSPSLIQGYSLQIYFRLIFRGIIRGIKFHLQNVHFQIKIKTVFLLPVTHKLSCYSSD